MIDDDITGRRWADWRTPEIAPRPLEDGTFGGLLASACFFSAIAVAAIATVRDSILPFAALALAIAVTTGLVRRQGRLARRFRDHFLGEGGDVPIRYQVFLRDGGVAVETGSDRGLLTEVDGWLVFRGERSDWSIARPDVLRGRTSWTFRGPGGRDRELRFAPVGVGAFTRSYGEFGRVVEAWCLSPVPEGSAVFPPVRPMRPTAWVSPAELLGLAVPIALGAWTAIITSPVIALLGFGPASVVAAGLVIRRHAVRRALLRSAERA